jgi:hypothetical protein
MAETLALFARQLEAGDVDEHRAARTRDHDASGPSEHAIMNQPRRS